MTKLRFHVAHDPKVHHFIGGILAQIYIIVLRSGRHSGIGLLSYILSASTSEETKPNTRG